MGRGKAKRMILTAPEPSSLLLLDHCSPQPSAAIKVNDGSCNFHQDNIRQDNYACSSGKYFPERNSRNLASLTPAGTEI